MMVPTVPGTYICPECAGGRTHEKSYSVWRSGIDILGKCHRASCGYFHKGVAQDLNAVAIGSPRGGADTPPLLPYRGYRESLSEASVGRFKARFGFDPRPHVSSPDPRHATLADSWILPIYDPRGAERGIMLASGLTIPNLKTRIIYKAKDEPMISWYRGIGELHQWDKVLLVEDQISAMKYTSFTGLRSCALLGTNVTASGIAEIQRTCKHVTIALDADATAVAFRLARRWGAAFDSCKVKILTQDIKDDPAYSTFSGEANGK
jgi:hypothetical protein